MTNAKPAVRTENIGVRVTPDERRLLEKAAEKSGIRLSDLVRRLTLTAADEFVGADGTAKGEG
jgi:uncharacterized protein (DUF1778 family)